MAKTAFATNNALTKKLYEEKLFRDAQKETYFAKFEGASADSLVQVQDKLTKDQGDAVTFGIRERLAGAGVTSGQTLEGNEEKLTTYDYTITLEQYRHAVRDAGAIDRKRAMFMIDEESQAALKTWAAEKKDQLCFDALMATPTRVFYAASASTTATTATAATAKAALTSTYKLHPQLIDYAKAWALTGGNRSQTPLRPVMIKGKKHLVMLIHPDVAHDLRQNATWYGAIRDAAERSAMDNPIFSGALGLYNGIIIHEHENVPIATDAGTGGNVPWAQCVLMGAQSLVWANGKRWEIRMEDFDYGNEHGYAISMIGKAGKPKFNSKDYGSVGIYVARTQISDAS